MIAPQKTYKLENRLTKTANNIIRFNDVKLQFGLEKIYDNISFGVNDGEFISILGPSGCGKSTSLRIIGGLLDISSGDVLVTNKAPKEAWRELSYVFQSARLVPWRNAIKNVMLGMELRYDGLKKGAMENRAKELLNLVGLSDDIEKFPSMLSGGERQRVAIARALAVDPKIILMDEPFAALDLNTRERLREELIDIWEKTKKTIIFVTHDIDEALILADRIILLSDKPTRVLETIEINEKRPRMIEESDNLRFNKAHLTELFKKLEKVY